MARNRDLTGLARECRVEKLPRIDGREVGFWVRPILENSTACTMSNAKNLVRRLNFSGWEPRRRFLWKTFKQQSKSVMICSVSFKLADDRLLGGLRR
jgi:hypothetical protein